MLEEVRRMSLTVVPGQSGRHRAALMKTRSLTRCFREHQLGPCCLSQARVRRCSFRDQRAQPLPCPGEESPGGAAVRSDPPEVTVGVRSAAWDAVRGVSVRKERGDR